MPQLSKIEQVWLTAWAAAVQNNVDNAFSKHEWMITVASSAAYSAVKQFKAAFPEEEVKEVKEVNKVPDPPKVEWVENNLSTGADSKIGDWELTLYPWINRSISYTVKYFGRNIFDEDGFQNIESAKAACEEKFRELWMEKHSKK